MAKIKYFLLGLLIGVILVGSASVVKAYLLKQKVLGESTVTVATLDLSTTPQTALFNLTKLAPGTTSGEQIIRLKNTGSTGIKYRVSVFPTNAENDNKLFQSLEYTLKSYTLGENLSKTYGGTGSLLKDLQNLEINQRLAEGEEKILKMEISLPASAGNDIEGTTTNFNIVFDATQSEGEF